MISTNYISQDLIPEVYIEKNLFQKEVPTIIEQNTLIQTSLVLLAIPVGVAVGRYYMNQD